eukprot:2174402-Heterocapsa_arctica.AAC.1
MALDGSVSTSSPRFERCPTSLELGWRLEWRTAPWASLESTGTICDIGLLRPIDRRMGTLEDGGWMLGTLVNGHASEPKHIHVVAIIQ